MKPNTKFYILLLVGVVIGLLFVPRGCHQVEKPKTADPAKTKQVVKAEEKIDRQLEDSLNAINVDLNASFIETQQALVAEQARSRKLEQSLSVTISKLKSANSKSAPVDSVVEIGQPFIDSPSLHNQVQELIASSINRDIMCNDAIGYLQKIISTKDSIIVLKDSSHARLLRHFDSTANDNISLLKYSKSLEKKNRWSKVEKFGWKAAAVAATVFILKTKL